MRNMNNFSTPAFMCVFFADAENEAKPENKQKCRNVHGERFFYYYYYYYATCARKIPIWLATKDGIMQLNLILYSALRELESRHAYKWFKRLSTKPCDIYDIYWWCG